MFLKKIMERFFGAAEENFWAWFCANEEILYDFENNQDFVLDKLRKAISKVHPKLTYEFGAKRDDGAREFVISADGNKAAFPAVESLYSKAPTLARWIFIKYRPRVPVGGILHFRGKAIDSNDIKYIMFEEDDPNKVGIILFIPGFSKEEQELFYGFGLLFLDHTLGEYDVETRMGSLNIFNADEDYYQKAHPLSQLPNHFDYCFRQTGTDD